MTPAPSFDLPELEPSATSSSKVVFEPAPTVRLLLLLLAAEDWFDGGRVDCIDSDGPGPAFWFGVMLLIFVVRDAPTCEAVVEALRLVVATEDETTVVVVVVVVVIVVVAVTEVTVAVVVVVVAVVVVVVVVVDVAVVRVVVTVVISSPAYSTPQPLFSSHALQLPDASQSPFSCVMPTTQGVPAAAISHVDPPCM